MNGHLKLNENLDDNLNEKLFWTGLISISHPLEKYLFSANYKILSNFWENTSNIYF